MADNGEDQGPLTVLRLTVEGFKQVVMVDAAPAASGITRVTGANGAGKSSYLDAVWWAMAAGKDGAVEDPIHHGERTARVTLDLGEITITRIADDAGQRLLVKRGETKVPAGQTLLDSLRAKLGFDPGEFERAAPDKQREMLLDAMGLRAELMRVTAEHQEVFARRAKVNSQIKELKGQIAGAPSFDGVPEAEIPAASIADELGKAMDVRVAHQKRDGALSQRRQGAETTRKGIQADCMEIARLEAELVKLRAKVEAGEKWLGQEVASIEAEANGIMESAAALPNVDDLRKRLSECEAVNTRVRERAKYVQLDATLAAAMKGSSDLTEELDAIDQKKTALLEGVAFPVKGVGFSDTGVTVDGVPWSSVAKSMRMKVSLAVAMALNPRLRVVLVRDASLLDESSVQVIEEMARERGYQVLMEFVSEDADGSSIHIVQGRLAEPPSAA